MSHIVQVPFTFEELLPYFSLTGGLSIYEITPPGAPPTTIIRTDQRWKVQFDWETFGRLNCVLCGSWELRVYLEEMGRGEFHLENATATVPFVSSPHSYSREIEFAANSVPVGLYKLTATIIQQGPGGPGPIVGFAEGPLVQFYKSCV